jgi:hydroxymethylglutaryl-CoA synthase
MTTFETKHACAGGTAALLATSALLGFSGSAKDRALVVCTDISRYDAPSTAEITQGSGAVAMVVERDPRLLELDMDRHGYFSSDVDDFFRPLGSTTAKVKGRYSMECYQDALEAAFRDYCGRRGGSPCELIDEVDYIALHVPFAKMPETALRKLLSETCGKNSDRIEEYLRRTRFLDAMTLNAEAGNLYTGSLYAYIMTLLSREYAVLGDGIVGKRILIASYGSGNTMIVFTATVRSGAPEVISAWDPEEVRRSARPADFSEYLAWLARPKEPEAWKHLLDGAAPRKGDFYLKGFSETGLRFYGRA